MRFVTKLEKALRPLDISFLRKITSRINTLKISNPELNQFLIQLENGEIVVKNTEQMIETGLSTANIPFIELPSVELPTSEMYTQPSVDVDAKMNSVAKEAISFTLKNMGEGFS